ncbi:FAD-binding oxidoreductase [Deinococcus sp. QL22]|uniref:FAD-binding oxidoreductase n=1 Tax=Deinococcus sp. QL22 TaxID=2939437 RepID=UPI002016AE4C|nr:FAD-binding oxidoreductase [Deinococcus sp. QL22]UQN06603.1 FAD-binding oxidoreductase [Deinococcus sp. QL22]
MPILELSPSDQTLKVTGDTPLLEVYAALPAGLYPPFPPVELPGGVGGLVSRGGFGQNFFFAAEVLGLTFISPSGQRIVAGGRTVKNVQGYDLTRPFVGSFGALGHAETVTLRLRPGLSMRHVVAPGTLETLPESVARFVWQHGPDLHLMHFGPFREVSRALSALPDSAEVPAPADLNNVFPQGIGLGLHGPLHDFRTKRLGQSWVSGGEVPPIPALFARLAASL